MGVMKLFGGGGLKSGSKIGLKSRSTIASLEVCLGVFLFFRVSHASTPTNQSRPPESSVCWPPFPLPHVKVENMDVVEVSGAVVAAEEVHTAGVHHARGAVSGPRHSSGGVDLQPRAARKIEPGRPNKKKQEQKQARPSRPPSRKQNVRPAQEKVKIQKEKGAQFVGDRGWKKHGAMMTMMM